MAASSSSCSSLSAASSPLNTTITSLLFHVCEALPLFPLVLGRIIEQYGLEPIVYRMSSTCMSTLSSWDVNLRVPCHHLLSITATAAGATRPIPLPIQTWTTLPPMPQFRQACSAARLDDFIYVTGGTVKRPTERFSYEATSTVNAYNIRTGIWSSSSVASLTRARVDHVTVACDDKLYVIGGQTPDSYEVHMCEVYDVKANRWSTFEKAGKEYWIHHAAVAYQHKIYVFGRKADGFHLCNGEPFAECYDTRTNRWSSLAAGSLVPPQTRS